jgi:copper chaperone CopZ
MSLTRLQWLGCSISLLVILVAVGCEKSESPPPAKPVAKTEVPAPVAAPATRPAAESPDEPLKAVQGTTLVQLDVQGMHCQGCGDTIAKKLKSLPGVKQARVSFNAKTGWVLLESSSATAGPQLLDAVKATGYKATLAAGSATQPS